VLGTGSTPPEETGPPPTQLPRTRRSPKQRDSSSATASASRRSANGRMRSSFSSTGEPTRSSRSRFRASAATPTLARSSPQEIFVHAFVRTSPRAPPRRSLMDTAELLDQLGTASVVQASGFRRDVTVFRLSAARAGDSGLEPAFRRNRAERVYLFEALISRRSQVQILPPLLEGPDTGPFRVRG
jgi:hypothetical protein